MGQHHEVRHEVLYVKEPGTERLRKNAAARLRYLLANGWRETERWHAQDHITVESSDRAGAEDDDHAQVRKLPRRVHPVKGSAVAVPGAPAAAARGPTRPRLRQGLAERGTGSAASRADGGPL